MPIKHAALKQIRKDRTRHARNQAVRAELKTLAKRFLTLLSQQKRAEAAALLRLLAKRFDRAASRRVIHPNTASRYNSRLSRRLNRAAARPA